MIQRNADLPLAELYEVDETAWLDSTAQLVAERRFDELDIDHLCEYLCDMAKRDRREVLSRLTVLIAHLLKWERPLNQRSNSWRATIAHQRDELGDLLESGTLRQHAEGILPQAFKRGRRQAAIEIGLGEVDFPAEWPYTLEQVLGNQGI